MATAMAGYLVSVAWMGHLSPTNGYRKLLSPCRGSISGNVGSFSPRTSNK